MNVDQIKLNEWEKKIVAEAAADHGRTIALQNGMISIQTLKEIGVVRENYNVQELRELGFESQGVVTSFDQVSKDAEERLRIDAPFAPGVRKWQLPIDVEGFLMQRTVFPAGTTVLSHSHDVVDPNVKGGSFRMITKGSIEFEGKTYLPGDWFFVPNGTPYSFKTDKDGDTDETYVHVILPPKHSVRLSHPKTDCKK